MGYFYEVIRAGGNEPYYVAKGSFEDVPEYEETPDGGAIQTFQPIAGYALVGSRIERVYQKLKYAMRVDLYDRSGVLVNDVVIYDNYLNYKYEADTPTGGGSGSGSGSESGSGSGWTPPHNIDNDPVYTEKGTYSFSGGDYVRGASDIYIYERDDIQYRWAGSGLCGPLSPYSCIRTAELNGDDTIELVHPYDTDGKWKYLKPGRVLKAWVLTQEPKRSAATVGMTEQYGTIDDDQIYWHVSGPGDIIEFSPQVILDGNMKQSEVDAQYRAELGRRNGYAKKNTVFDEVISYDAGDYWGYEWDAFLVKFQTAAGNQRTEYIDSKYVMKYVNTYNTTRLQLPYGYRPQQYTIIGVDFGQDDITVTARARSIDDCMYLYSARNEAEDNIFPQRVDTIIANSVANVTNSGQSMGDIRIHCYPQDTAIIGYTSGSGTLQDILNTLRGTYTFDILRDNGEIYLYNYLGSDRGVALEVGRNLTALGICLETVGADMDGTLTYYSDDENGTHFRYYKASTPAGGVASRTMAVQDDRALSHYAAMGAGAGNSVLAGDAQEYTRRTLKKRGTFRMTLTPEVLQMDDGGAPVELKEPLLIGDTVTIKDPKLSDGSVKARIVGATQDCITGRILSVTVGDLPEKLYSVIVQMMRNS